ncbi:MAG: amidohydrolase family protein [Thermogutta sp.]
MTSSPEMCLTADLILPLDRPPIAHGMINVTEGRITSLRPMGDGFRLQSAERSLPSAQCAHYPKCAILPGFINAHTHLDLSGWSRSFSGQPKLWEWIPEVVRFRRSQHYRPEKAIKDGMWAALAGGAVALVDVIPPDWLTWERLSGSELTPGKSGAAALQPSLPPLRIFSFIECLAPTGSMRIPPDELFDHHRKACLHLGWHPAISPHAPYTVPLEVLKTVVNLAERHNLILAMHLAETDQEALFLATGEGPLRDMLEKLSAYRPGVFTPGRALQELLDVICRAPRVLLIHGNYLTESEIALLSRFTDRAAVVYCPRSHEFFGHANYPLEQLLEASIPVLVGTDSRASHPDLSIFGELQAVRRRHPKVKAERIVRMATTDAARFLGCDGELGSLAVGQSATFCIIQLPTQAIGDDPYEAVLSPQAQVRAVWIEGKLVFERTTR